MGGHSKNCGDCGYVEEKCVCKKNNFGCAFKTAGIIGVVLVVLIAGASFTAIGIDHITKIANHESRVFGDPSIRVEPMTRLRQEAAVMRASDYLKAVGSFMWLDILAAIVPIALLCCMNSMCKTNEQRYHWFTRFGLAIAVLILILVAQGIATLYFSSRATWLAGWVLLLAAVIGMLGALCLSVNWRMVIQLVVSFICIGLALYLLVVSPSYQTIMGGASLAVVP